MDLTQGQVAVASGPDQSSGHPQAGVGFRLEAEFQFPEFLPFRRREQLQAGPGGSHLAGDGLAPVVAGAAEALLLFLIELEFPVAAGKALFPGRQERIEAGCTGLEGFA